MIPQPFGPILGGLDCESHQDFWQYYRNRYFGLREGGVIVPATPTTIRSKDEIHLQVYSPTLDIEETRHATFSELQKTGLFGHALLGTSPTAHTYVYTSTSGYRESAKGISIGRLSHFIPDQYSEIIQNFLRRKGGELASYASGEHASGLERTRIVFKLFNKQMFEWDEALGELLKGNRIGANISAACGIHFKEGDRNLKFSMRTKTIGDVVLGNGGYEVVLTDKYKLLASHIRTVVPADVEVY